MSIGHILGLLRPNIIIPQTTWNPADKSAGITLTNANRTATGNTSSYQNVRATKGFFNGKYYLEILWNVSPGSFMSWGFANASASLTAYPGSDTNSVGVYKDGTLYYNGATMSGGQGTGFQSLGTVSCIAVDLTNRLFWVRANNGTWYGAGGTSGDPVAGTNGRALPLTGIVFPFFGSSANGDQGIVNFAAANFAYSAPSGFLPWESSGDISVMQQRAYAIIGAQTAGISVAQQRAYGIVGAQKDGLSIHSHKAYSIVGIPPSGQLAVHSQRAYAIIFP